MDLARPAVSVPSGTFGTYHALVIGNNLYTQWPQLRTAVNDANAVSEVLRRKYGFKTKVLLNATHEQILNALNDSSRRSAERQPADLLRGARTFDLGKRGYWIPVDGEPTATRAGSSTCRSRTCCSR